MGTVFMGVGALVMALGGFLWWGNMSGHFRSFPFAGYITIGIGGAIFGYGRRKNAEAAAAKLFTPPS
jgi:hypothetical protein